MIDSIRLQNYKAFKDVTISLRPLTILLGANSVGKSSILQMLMLLHQTAEERGNKYSSALKIYGGYVNIGAYENLFKEKNIKMSLCIDVDIESSSLLDEIRRMKRDYIRNFQMLCRHFPLKSLWELSDMPVESKRDFQSLVGKILSNINKVGAVNYKSDLARFLLQKTGIYEDIKSYDQDQISSTYNLLDYLENGLKQNILRIKYEISIVRGNLMISKLVITSFDDKKIISIEYNDRNMSIINSDIVEFNTIEENIIHNFFRYNATLFKCIDKEEKDCASPLVFIILKVIRMTLDKFQEDVSEYKINYVSPLRAHPKRYYMLDKAKMTISLDTLDGDAIAEVLKENERVRDRVNVWFSKFGFKIDVKEFKEVIHHVNVTQNNLSLNITDVGFGISQVLPIIIQGFLSIDNSITIVEQPEIHLHPMMQADLGDLFIDIVKEQQKKLIIETHSEYLLKRIRRRISEGVISPSMVSICLFHPKTATKDAWVEQLSIAEKGDFEWPEEFYGGELYNDITEFLKNQKNQ